MEFAKKVDEIREAVRRLPILVATFPRDPTYSVPPSTMYTETQAADIGIIKTVTVKFYNTDGLVDVRLEFKGRNIIPSEISDSEWINKSDTETQYPVDLEINDRGDLKYICKNRDTAWKHRVPVDVLYTRRV